MPESEGDSSSGADARTEKPSSMIASESRGLFLAESRVAAQTASAKRKRLIPGSWRKIRKSESATSASNPAIRRLPRLIGIASVRISVVSIAAPLADAAFRSS
jgi:hypothetical protein